ncbi:MAG: lysostaphin resistance A-like protein [Pyrinomonadaceae bacterium]
MDPQHIFINEFGRLRSGWRLLVFILVLIALNLLAGTVLRFAYALLHNAFAAMPHAEFFANAIFRLVLLFAALLAGYLCNRLLEQLPWRALGLTLHPGWLRDFAAGTAIGLFSLALAALITFAVGSMRFSFDRSQVFNAIPKALASSAVLFIFAALAEEATFRGYPLQTLSRAKLIWLGVFLTSVPFATVHLWNPNVVPVVTFANTALAGVWLAVAYLRTRSLWLPLGIHWAWNWALGSLLGLPVSGLTLLNHPLLTGTDLGPKWLTGGEYGLEGGVACTLALIVSTFFLLRTRWLTANPELKKLTSEENPVVPPAVLSIQTTDLHM